MRAKKQKRHRRAVRFYTACFGFREPFKILCDGTFVHHLLANQITPLIQHWQILSLFGYRCVLAELRSLGNTYTDSLDAARKLMTARCDHEKRKSSVACIIEVIGEKNTEHFFVASQDAELRKKFQEKCSLSGPPPPSTFQHKFVKTAEEKRSHMTDLEYEILTLKSKKEATDETNDSSDANEDHILETRDLKRGVERNRIDTKDKAQFKRNKSKGPNPLSCKKKRSEGNTRATSGEEISTDKSTRSRSRKRKRPRKSKITIEPIVR